MEHFTYFKENVFAAKIISPFQGPLGLSFQIASVSITMFSTFLLQSQCIYFQCLCPHELDPGKTPFHMRILKQIEGGDLPSLLHNSYQKPQLLRFSPGLLLICLIMLTVLSIRSKRAVLPSCLKHQHVKSQPLQVTLPPSGLQLDATSEPSSPFTFLGIKQRHAVIACLPFVLEFYAFTFSLGDIQDACNLQIFLIHGFWKQRKVKYYLWCQAAKKSPEILTFTSRYRRSKMPKTCVECKPATYSRMKSQPCSPPPKTKDCNRVPTATASHLLTL